jgi:hypothetical protein
MVEREDGFVQFFWVRGQLHCLVQHGKCGICHVFHHVGQGVKPHGEVELDCVGQPVHGHLHKRRHFFAVKLAKHGVGVLHLDLSFERLWVVNSEK